MKDEKDITDRDFSINHVTAYMECSFTRNTIPMRASVKAIDWIKLPNYPHTKEGLKQQAVDSLQYATRM